MELTTENHKKMQKCQKKILSLRLSEFAYTT